MKVKKRKNNCDLFMYQICIKNLHVWYIEVQLYSIVECINSIQKMVQLTKNKITISLLTTPFWTLKPNWYLVSGLLILTSTTGAHGTTVSFTTVWVLEFCKLKKIQLSRNPASIKLNRCKLKKLQDYR